MKLPSSLRTVADNYVVEYSLHEPEAPIGELTVGIFLHFVLLEMDVCDGNEDPILQLLASPPGPNTCRQGDGNYHGAIVVYFDQGLGAGPATCWSKSSFSTFLC